MPLAFLATWAHIQAAVNQHSQVLLCWAAFQPLFPKPVALHGVAVAQVQDLALGLVEPHTIDLGPSTQPVQVPLQSLPTLHQINTPTQLGVICKLTEGALDPFVQIIDKDVKQNWPQHRALGNTACDRPPTGVNSIHHHSLGLAVQPVLYPAKSTPVQAMSSQFLQENAGGETLEQVAQRSCRCPVIGSVQGQAGWGFEQPALVEDVPAHGRAGREPQDASLKPQNRDGRSQRSDTSERNAAISFRYRQ
ncbi:hypothetical protein QYF61_018093, partial [Mycteria americana]